MSTHIDTNKSGNNLNVTEWFLNLPNGLIVFSSVSLSLLFPLDIRAAMENAFAREESCGFGEAVYSMAVRSFLRVNA